MVGGGASHPKHPVSPQKERRKAREVVGEGEHALIVFFLHCGASNQQSLDNINFLEH